VEAAQRADAVSVALAQPHRNGELDPLAGSALGRYCLKRWPGAERKDLREARCEAGNRYAQAIDNDRVARGLAPRIFGESAGFGVLSDEQLRARRDLCAQQLAEAEDAMRGVIGRAIGVLRRVCWEDLDVRPTDEDVVFHGLYCLAKHFGLVKRAFHEA
jgi:hypothetical protein